MNTQFSTYMRKALFLLFAGIFAGFYIQAAKRHLCDEKVFKRTRARFFKNRLYTTPLDITYRKPLCFPYVESLHKQRYRGHDFKEKPRSFFPYFTIGVAGLTAGAFYHNEVEAACPYYDDESLRTTYASCVYCTPTAVGIIKERIEEVLRECREFKKNYRKLRDPMESGIALLKELTWCLTIQVDCKPDDAYGYDHWAMCFIYKDLEGLYEDNNYVTRLKRSAREVCDLTDLAYPSWCS